MRLLRRASFLIVLASLLKAQQPQAHKLLAQALQLADLYNWADATPLFAGAEHLFADAGDQRNALYARLGMIRSNIERDQIGRASCRERGEISAAAAALK